MLGAPLTLNLSKGMKLGDTGAVVAWSVITEAVGKKAENEP